MEDKLSKLIDKDISLNEKYRDIANYKIKEKEKYLGRLLTCKEIEKIFNQTKRELKEKYK